MGWGEGDTGGHGVTRCDTVRGYVAAPAGTWIACHLLSCGARAISGSKLAMGGGPRPREEPGSVEAHHAEHPGSCGEDVANALGTDTKTLRPTVKELIAAKRLKTKGKARGMQYATV